MPRAPATKRRSRTANQTGGRGQLRFTAVLERSTNRLWGAHVRVPGYIAASLAAGDSLRVFCSINGSEEHQCAVLPFGSGVSVITVNKQRRDALGLEFGTEVAVSLRKDESRYGLPLPAEMAEVLRQDPEGSKLFHALTPGRRRTLLYIVGSGRGSENRVARAITTLKHLKANGGKINFRQLYLMLKSPRMLPR